MPRTVKDFSDAIVKVDLDEQDRQAQVIISKSYISQGSQISMDERLKETDTAMNAGTERIEEDSGQPTE